MQLNFCEDGGNVVLSLAEIGKDNSEGWLTANVIFDYKSFTARFPIYLMLNDIYAFLGELKELNKHLKGRAAFATIEGNVDIVLLGDGLGHIGMKGLIRHSNDQSLLINFEVPSDQTFLASLVAQCEEIIKGRN